MVWDNHARGGMCLSALFSTRGGGILRFFYVAIGRFLHILGSRSPDALLLPEVRLGFYVALRDDFPPALYAPSSGDAVIRRFTLRRKNVCATCIIGAL